MRRGVSLIIKQNPRNILAVLITYTNAQCHNHSITITMFIFFRRIFRFCSLYTSNKKLVIIFNQKPMMMKLTKCTTIAHGAALGSQWPHIRSSVNLVIIIVKKTICNVSCALTRSFFVIVGLYVTTRLRLRLRPGNQASLLRC